MSQLRQMARVQNRSTKVAASLASGYLILGSAYIVWSTQVVSFVARSASLASQIEQWKGLGFIAVTASLLFLLIRKSHARMEASENTAKDSIKSLNLALDAGRVMVWSIDSDSGKIQWTGNAPGILSLPSGRGVDTLSDFISCLDPECREDVRSHFDDAEAPGAIDTTVSFTDCSGRKRYLALRGETRKTKSSNVLHGTASDISREKELEASLQQQATNLEVTIAERTAELLTTVEELETFSYTVAHDLRTPLRGIISTSRILIEDHGEELSPPAVAKLKRQEEAAKRMALLIDDLLTMSRFSRAEVARVKFDLSLLTQEVLTELNFCTSFPNVRFEIDERMRTYADPKLVRVLLQNLLENACKFSKPEGGLIKVGREGETFYVRDDGVGFDPAYSSRLFKPFERLHGAVYEGTGIGLATVRRIIDRHSGQIWAEGKPGEGACFYFTLPEVGMPTIGKAPLVGTSV